MEEKSGLTGAKFLFVQGECQGFSSTRWNGPCCRLPAVRGGGWENYEHRITIAAISWDERFFFLKLHLETILFYLKKQACHVGKYIIYQSHGWYG